jgi:hypothetical protein
VENVPIENFESNNGRYAFLISNHFCHHSFLSLSLSGHFYLTFPSTVLFVNFCASQLCAPSVIDDIPLSIRLIITPRLLPLPRLVRNVKVVKLKPLQPAKYSSCV